MMIEKAKEIIASTSQKMAEAVEFLDEDLKTYRAGKANPAVFNAVMVNYYGSMTPVPQVASINTPDAKTIIIQPWDKKMIPAIEKAIMDANIGFTPQNNGEQIRINVPALTEERRRELVKTARTAGENAKISIRNARREGIDILRKLQKEGMPEDVVKVSEVDIQKETDTYTKNVDDLLADKEKEIMTV
jgi:ribosome recycling factor